MIHKDLIDLVENKSMTAHIVARMSINIMTGDQFTLVCNGKEFPARLLHVHEVERMPNEIAYPQADGSEKVVSNGGITINHIYEEELDKFFSKTSMNEEDFHKLAYNMGYANEVFCCEIIEWEYL